MVAIIAQLYYLVHLRSDGLRTALALIKYHFLDKRLWTEWQLHSDGPRIALARWRGGMVAIIAQLYYLVHMRSIGAA